MPPKKAEQPKKKKATVDDKVCNFCPVLPRVHLVANMIRPQTFGMKNVRQNNPLAPLNPLVPRIASASPVDANH